MRVSRTQTGEGNGPHSSTFAWKIPWMEEPGRLQSMGSLESDTTERLHFHFSLSCIGEGNGNPLWCSCLESPRDGKPGGLPSVGSHKVGHDWSDLAAAAGPKVLQLTSFPFFPPPSALPLDTQSRRGRPNLPSVSLQWSYGYISIFISDNFNYNKIASL